MKNRLKSSSTPSLSGTSLSGPSTQPASRTITTTTTTTASNSTTTCASPSHNTRSQTDGGSNHDSSSNHNQNDDDNNDNKDNDGHLSSRRSSATSTSRPGFFSRLSLPLTLRSRRSNIADFHIRANEPHKKYSAGDHILGCVVLVVVKPIRITHLTVSLNGHVRVLKDLTASVKPPVTFSGGSEQPQYHGNGFASLFQDEQVLSGDGRLEPGKYEFGFDLVFPSKGLPSSIDFERGMISYNITSTLTRPTSITPTKSCDTKVMLVEKVDIGLIAPPRPRTIFLEPVSKRKRRKRSTALDRASASSATQEVNDLVSEVGSIAQSAIAEEPRAFDIHSDVLSEISGESTRSVSTGGFSRAELAQVHSIKQQAVDNKTITATIELLRGGCLPGDTVSIRVTVQHIKRIKSMAGVIVTLFRQGRIDSSPLPTSFVDAATAGDKTKTEAKGAMTKSRTGLGGLSLSSSSSTSVFRKDLDQSMAPLIVNPSTLHTSVTVSVKLPDDSFPTIRNVPGDMVSFRYQVEVIVDLGGRLSNHFQGSQPSRFGNSSTRNHEGQNVSFSPGRGASIADTATLRREKGAISVTMETIVGTVDSSLSSRGGKRVSNLSTPTRAISIGQGQVDEDDLYHAEHSQHDDGHHHWGTPYTSTSGYSSNSYFIPQHERHRSYVGPLPIRSQNTTLPAIPLQPYPYQQTPPLDEASPHYIPPPQLPDPLRMSDKDRIRQAETRLLPSEPPAVETSSSSSANNIQGPNIYDAEDTPSGPSSGPSNTPNNDTIAGPSAPIEEDIIRASNAPSATEDKQELQRRFLLAEASAPPEVPDDNMTQQHHGTSEAGGAGEFFEPSAPVLGTEDEEDGDEDGYRAYGVGPGPSNDGDRRHDEQLPAYER